MASKHREEVLMILKTEEIQSTREILDELQTRTKKVINWTALYKILSDLERDGRAKRFAVKGGIFWMRKTPEKQ